MNASGARVQGGWSSTIGRGVGLFAGLGAVLAGSAATLDWPIVGTFFGVLEGGLAGAVFGLVDAVVLTAVATLAWATPSRWGARATSGVATGATVLLAVQGYTGPIAVPSPVTAAFLVIATLAGALFGPMIAFGMESRRAGSAPGRLPRILRRFLAWGAGVGAGLGAVTGLVIGLRTFVPTAGFAVVEGAMLGAVSGLLLACLAVGLSLLPRVRARR